MKNLKKCVLLLAILAIVVCSFGCVFIPYDSTLCITNYSDFDIDKVEFYTSGSSYPILTKYVDIDDGEYLMIDCYSSDYYYIRLYSDYYYCDYTATLNVGQICYLYVYNRDGWSRY